MPRFASIARLNRQLDLQGRTRLVAPDAMVGFGKRRLGKVIWALALSVIAVPILTAHSAQASVTRHKEHKRDYKREIEVAEQQWRTAQLAGDVAAMDKLLASDYFGISITGQLNDKTQQLERLQKRTLVVTRLDVSDVKIKLVGRVGIVTSLASIEGTNNGASLRGNYRYTRIYRRYPDGSWKITNFEVTRVPGETEAAPSTPAAEH